MSARGGHLVRLRAVFASDGDPYAGGDLATALRLGGLLWVVATAFAALLLVLAPPDQALGRWGWLVAAAVMGLGVVAARRLLHGEVGWNVLLAGSYAGTAQIALLQWLAGGVEAPYGELYLLVGLYAGGVHPPRRVLGVLAAIAAASIAPLVYDGVSAPLVGQVATRLLLVSAVALLASALMRTVRAQRVALRDRGQRAEDLARLDELTGLANRRAFDEALAAEVSRAQRQQTPLSLIVADLDGFKGVNDAYGHPAGDACLKAAARSVMRELRAHDRPFRWGGDEFAVLLPDATVTDAEAVCRRLAAAVAAECEAPDGTAVQMTCAAAELQGGMTGAGLVSAADGALLERKRARVAALGRR